MNTRSTTWVESDQLAQAAVNVLRNEELVPKNKRWPFSRVSKAYRDYDKAVQEITVRRREARERAVELTLRKERAEADSVFERAETTAQAVYDETLAEARKPYDKTEIKARSERDAAIAAANLAYQQATEKANRVYQGEAAAIDQKRGAAIGEAKNIREAAYAALEEKRKAEIARIAKDLKTIPLEGPMRVIEDKQVWPPDERKKALIGLIDMSGREDFDAEYADLCLRNVVGYIFQDRYLKPDAQHHRLMEAVVLEALVDLAARTPSKRPTIVKHMHDIVVQNPGHSSVTFIKNLTELYVTASGDTRTIYNEDLVENEIIFDNMRAHIADTLKLTPRRSLVPPAAGAPVREPTLASVGAVDDDEQTPLMKRPSESDADITADMNVDELVSAEATDGFRVGRK